VLVVHRRLVHNRVPTVPGGGTVAFVDPLGHRYLDDPVGREEGGTPAIVESIRAGLVFAVKQAVGTDLIQAREERFWRRALHRWDRNPSLEILGNRHARRLSIVSFRIRAGSIDGRPGYLHHNFVVAVLNDLFGIQARGGCFCAGPYLQRLHDLDEELVRAMESEVLRGSEGIKLGWFRVNFNYFVSPEVVDYVIDAVNLVADEGHRLLPLYRFDPFSGLWHHRSGRARPPVSLFDISYRGAAMEFLAPRSSAPEHVLPQQLEEARRVIAGLGASPGEPVEDPQLPPSFEAIRWFPLPGEAATAP
jgi:hypothetical protein